MNIYKNKYGFQIAGTLSACWLCASFLNMPELLEISGAIMIIQSMWIWKNDYQNFKQNVSSLTLTDLKSQTENALVELQALAEDFTVDKGYFKLAESMDSLTLELDEIYENLKEEKDEELINKVKDMKNNSLGSF